MQRTLLLSMTLLLFLATTSHGAEPVDLEGAAGARQLASIALRVEGGAEASTHGVLRWTRPPVEGRRYALRGRVSYQGVEGDAYLEMWSHFGKQGSYFSRTLAKSGALATLEGDSPERDFALPFDTGDPPMLPDRIDVNLVLPGEGRVALHELRWSAHEDQVATSAGAGAWWSERQAGALGGIGGSALGLIGALIGTLCSAGRARNVTMSALALQLTFGVISLVAGVYALFISQPAHVSLVLIGIGFFAAAMALGARAIAGRRYRDLEFRRMHALDLDVGSGHPQR